jgi:DNA-binding response OmpR family regulator
MATMKRRILVIEDDPKTVELVTLYLERDGYEVHSAYDGLEGLKRSREVAPDLVVLDLMLPKLDGMGVCRILREESGAPIIMLTARSTEQDKLGGLDIGADDYVTKPFSPRELVARVRVVLRRTADDGLYSGPSIVEMSGMKVDFMRHEVTNESGAVHLTPTEFRILGALIREPGRVFSRNQLIEKVLGYDFEGSERTIDVHVLNLRRKIEPDDGKTCLIRSVYGVGYKFEG